MGTNTCLCALVLAAVLLGGCAAAPLALGAAGGVATFKYLENQEVREYERPLEAVFDATLAALRNLEYPPPAMTLPEHKEAKLESGDLSIAMAQFPEGKTRVAIRVGTFETGNHRRRAQLVHEAIARNLGVAHVAQAAPAIPPAEPYVDVAARR